MRARTCSFVLIVLSLATISVCAEDAPTGPPAELSQLSYFSGRWGCTGMAFETPFGPEHATKAKASAESDLGGMWLRLNYDEEKTDVNPMPVHVMMMMGYDVEKKQFVGVCFDSFGQHCAQSSSGWKEDVLLIEGHSSMGDAGVRDTFTKLNANSFTHLGEMQSPAGEWMNLDKETCTRK